MLCLHTHSQRRGIKSSVLNGISFGNLFRALFINRGCGCFFLNHNEMLSKMMITFRDQPGDAQGLFVFRSYE